MTGAERGWPVRRTLVIALRGGPKCPPTRDLRERQLRDEVKSGGNQPTDIRVIHRRNKPPALRSRHVERKGGWKQSEPV